MVGRLMNDELKMMWKEVAVAYLKVLFHNSFSETQETTKNTSWDNQYPSDILTRHLLNISQKHYHLSQFA
jgi:hypothetical protein